MPSPIRASVVGFDRGAHLSSNTLIKFIEQVFGPLSQEKDSQVIFVREDLASHHELLMEFPNDAIRVLFASEMSGSNLDFFDYVIGWETNLSSERFFRMPPAMREEWFFQNEVPFDAIPMKERRFCNFIYSNSKAHPFRDKFFRELNARMSVDSLGKHFNNLQIPEKIKDSKLHWGHEKIILQSNYKFSIAFENGLYDGYTTEKLITASLAGSVPIYWGNPQAAIDFNPERFISLHDFESAEQAIQSIVELSFDDSKLQEMVSRPLLTDAQSLALDTSKENLLDYLHMIKTAASMGRINRPTGSTASESERLFLEMYKTRETVQGFKSVFGKFLGR